LSSGDDFIELCKQVTTKGSKPTYALCHYPGENGLAIMLEMMGAPNGWSEEDGKFTSVYETPAMTDALSQIKSMWDAGYFHPDSFSKGPSARWIDGSSVLYTQDYNAWLVYAGRYPDWSIGSILPPKWGGGGIADKALGQPAYLAFAGFKKASDDRIKELLRVFNFLASPFGTQEFLLVNYGVNGVDYKLEGSDPVATKSATANRPPGLGYLGTVYGVNLYVPGYEDYVSKAYKYIDTVMPTGKQDPSRFLYSETALTAGSSATNTLRDAIDDMILGRKKISEWAGLAATWRKKAGDAMRSEYEAAYAAGQS
jgi:putative aldouronate transport system substrate-binding protein